MAELMKIPVEVRFNKYVIKNEDPDKCWGWKGAILKGGYGQMRTDGRCFSSHRVAYELYNGNIPDDMWVLHKCDRPVCCNPRHLFLGTAKDNSNDRDLKNRGARKKGIIPIAPKLGSKHPNAVLNEDKVREIKSMLVAGKTGASIARLFNVTKENIYAINKGKAWKHVQLT